MDRLPHELNSPDLSRYVSVAPQSRVVSAGYNIPSDVTGAQLMPQVTADELVALAVIMRDFCVTTADAVPVMVREVLPLAYEEWAYDHLGHQDVRFEALPQAIQDKAIHMLCRVAFDEIDARSDDAVLDAFDAWQRHLDTTRKLNREGM